VVSHLNLQAIFSRTHEPGGFLGLIVEGPQRWPVRPVLELAGELERGGTGTLSLWLVFIWTVSPSLPSTARSGSDAQDEALEGHTSLVELRVGLTWSFPVFQHSCDGAMIWSGLASMTTSHQRVRRAGGRELFWSELHCRELPSV